MITHITLSCTIVGAKVGRYVTFLTRYFPALMHKKLICMFINSGCMLTRQCLLVFARPNKSLRAADNVARMGQREEGGKGKKKKREGTS